MVHQIINFAIDAFARNKDLLDERKLLVVFIDFAFDERPDLLARAFAGGDFREVMHDRRHLPIDAVLDQRHRLAGKHLRQGRVGLGQVIQTLADKRPHLRLETRDRWRERQRHARGRWRLADRQAEGAGNRHH